MLQYQAITRHVNSFTQFCTMEKQGFGVFGGGVSRGVKTRGRGVIREKWMEEEVKNFQSGYDKSVEHSASQKLRFW